MIYESIMAFTSRIYCFTSFVNTTQGFPKPLSKEDERDLVLKMQDGDKKARDLLINHNLRLVAHIVKKFSNSLEADDLISVGTIGLMKAVDSYTLDKCTQLSTYASRCIENEILMLIRSNKRHKDTISLNSMCKNKDDNSEIELEEILQSGEEIGVLEQVEQSYMFSKAMEVINKKLSDIEKKVILNRYGIGGAIPKTQREVAVMLGISRSYISRIETRALNLIKEEIDE